MITGRRTIVALAIGLFVATSMAPGVAQTRAHRGEAARAEARHQGEATRSAVMQQCTGQANAEYPWFEDMNRTEAYRACMAAHGEPEA